MLVFRKGRALVFKAWLHNFRVPPVSDFLPEKRNAAGADESFKFSCLDLACFSDASSSSREGSAVFLKRKKRSQIPIGRAVEEPDPVKGSDSPLG